MPILILLIFQILLGEYQNMMMPPGYKHFLVLNKLSLTWLMMINWRNTRISLSSRAFSGFRGWADDGEEEGDEVNYQIGKL